MIYYFIYALAQAILFTRFVVKDDHEPVACVALALIVAPLLTVGLCMGMIHFVIYYLATGKTP